jgi:cell division protein FtsZ
VVTRPFTFEGAVRRGRADRGIESLRHAADVLVAISNDRLIETAAKGLAITQAFELADGILYQGVQGISDLVTVRGLVNLDFADLRVVLSGAGQAMMGMGQGSGEQRAVTAAKTACSNPLLEAGSIRGARKIILNVTGGNDLTLGEVTDAADTVRRFAATECDLVFGAVVRDDLAGEEEVRLTVIAADFGEPIEESERDEHGTGHPRRRVSVDEDLDVPTYLRRSQRAKEAPPPSSDRAS